MVEKLEIDLSEKEEEIKINPHDFEIPFPMDALIKRDRASQMLRPKEIIPSLEEENNPVAALVDGNPESKWSVKGNNATVTFDFGKQILIDYIQMDFHMKKNEKRLYKFDIRNITRIHEDKSYDYEPLAMDLDNNKERSGLFEIRNWRINEQSNYGDYISYMPCQKIMFAFTRTSSRRKRFSINDISMFGFYLSDVEVVKGGMEW